MDSESQMIRELDLNKLIPGQLLGLCECMDARGRFKDDESMKMFKFLVRDLAEAQDFARRFEEKRREEELDQAAPSCGAGEQPASSPESLSAASFGPSPPSLGHDAPVQTPKGRHPADGDHGDISPELRQRRKPRQGGESDGQQQPHQAGGRADEQELARPLLKC
ncbi:unnamed protein product [Vitrella brassicaformis CCMP3155]|uniref:Uncharacterized protein n=1 Tax=Vitrella brassicaformis (strain CCMP3155) TaxID=1169540 RepID=A0A0G4GEB5_VITBC|nr:unnamed protein product [Vitrella brassicaformis CCMP3155]|eukprot:CEM27671.1 unnamed protein product [Vitrella brassicaformis CCMP3155]